MDINFCIIFLSVTCVFVFFKTSGFKNSLCNYMKGNDLLKS